MRDEDRLEQRFASYEGQGVKNIGLINRFICLRLGFLTRVHRFHKTGKTMHLVLQSLHTDTADLSPINVPSTMPGTRGHCSTLRCHVICLH